MAYEELNPVNITFGLTDHDEPRPIRNIKLCDVETNEVFDDLLEITLVFVTAVIREAKKDSDLYILARFFAIDSQEDADRFDDDLGQTKLGGELIRMYNSAVANVQGLLDIEDSSYFQWRLTEAKAEEIKIKAEIIGWTEGRAEGIEIGQQKGIEIGKKETAVMMRIYGEPEEKIIRYTGYAFKELDALN